MRKEEQNFISLNEIDNMALIIIMPTAGEPGHPVVTESEASPAATDGKDKMKKRGDGGHQYNQPKSNCLLN